MMPMAPMHDAAMMGVMPAQNMGGMPPQMFQGQAMPKSTAPPPVPPNGGGATPSSPSGNRKLGGSKMRTPENPWADMQDSHQDASAELAAMGWKNQSSGFPQKGGGPPPAGSGKGKGRKDGKGMDDGKGSRGQQDVQHSGWVPKSEVRQDKGGKGQARQEQWAPKAVPAPKAPVPEPLSIASGKGGKGGGSMPMVSGGAPAGGKKASKSGRRDAQMEDWLSLRFGGSPPPDAPAEGSRNEASDWDKSEDIGYDDYDYNDDGGGDSRRKRKGKGGKGKADKRADKGKGKGKSGKGGGVWRSTG